MDRDFEQASQLEDTLYGRWRRLMSNVLQQGGECSPRGQRIKELLGVQLVVPDARYTLLVDPARDLNYRFMAAEFLWIAAGRNDLETLQKYNRVYANFSDDGVKLAGAYGPRLAPQWDFILQTLTRDPDSRQAVASIWTPTPEPSKDIPCTVAAQFLLRGGALHSIWTMRSSDLWLGLPYDVWTFSMLQAALAGSLQVRTGSLTMQLGSAHLYEPHWDAARRVLQPWDFDRLTTGPHGKAMTPGSYLNPKPSHMNISWAEDCLNATAPGFLFTGTDGWKVCARAIRAVNKGKALEVLLDGATANV